MIISQQVLLVIGFVIAISPPILSATRARQNHAACHPFPYISLDHGKITPIGTQKYLFKCNPGYFLTSPPQVRCWKGKWSSTKEPRCSRAEGQCEDPDPLTGGDILGEERHEGAVIQYMCKPGFILMGQGTRTCLRSGHWSGITPTCMDQSEPLQNVAERFKEKFVTDMGSHSTDNAACHPFPYISLDHGKITPIGTQKYLFKCNPGYFLTSPPQVRCWKGKWSSTKEPRCSRAEGQCEDPDPLTGGDILGEERHEGAVIQYMCKPGFILMGQGTRTCLRSGHWSGITPTCMDQSEPLQNVAERFKEKFVTDMGSHSTDITWDTNREIQAPCSSTEEESGLPCRSSFNTNSSAEDDNDASKDLAETENDYDLSPVSIDFPPNDRHFIRRHNRKHKSKREKLAFETNLFTIIEDIEGEEAGEVFSVDTGFGDEKVLLLDNTPCYITPSLKRVKNDGQSKSSFKNRGKLPSSRDISSSNTVRKRRRNRKLRKSGYRSPNIRSRGKAEDVKITNAS